MASTETRRFPPGVPPARWRLPFAVLPRLALAVALGLVVPLGLTVANDAGWSAAAAIAGVTALGLLMVAICLPVLDRVALAPGRPVRRSLGRPLAWASAILLAYAGCLRLGVPTGFASLVAVALLFLLIDPPAAGGETDRLLRVLTALAGAALAALASAFQPSFLLR